jgi:transcriptional regulator with XRE-family HTH domain
MEDLARGERIKALRRARRLTQPAVVELLEDHAGASVVTLRGYQAWEAGGGIRWDNAKLLADVLGVDAEQLMTGAEGPPSPLDSRDGQLNRIESVLGQVLERLAALEDLIPIVDPLERGRASAQRAVGRARERRRTSREDQLDQDDQDSGAADAP